MRENLQIVDDYSDKKDDDYIPPNPKTPQKNRKRSIQQMEEGSKNEIEGGDDGNQINSKNKQPLKGDNSARNTPRTTRSTVAHANNKKRKLNETKKE